MGSEYVDAKKAVAHKAAPEIINHISGINLDIAADISELIVEQTLDKLEKCNAKLVSHMAVYNCFFIGHVKVM